MTTPTPTTNKHQRKATRGALVLMLGTLASRFTGLLRTAIMLRFIPDPAASDAFWAAWKIPNLFRELLAEGALINAFVPVYKELSKEDAKRLSHALFSLLLLVNALLLAVVWLGAPYISNLLLANSSDIDSAQTTLLIRILFPLLTAFSLSALAMGLLNAEERFFAPAWAPVTLNIAMVIALVLFPADVTVLAIASVVGGLGQFAFQLPFLRRLGLLPRFRGLNHPALISIVLLSIPFAFTTGGRHVLNVVVTRLLTGLELGSVTAYENANLILSMTLGLFATSPALAFYSRLSANAQEDPEAFAHTLRQGLQLISFFCIPVGLLVFCYAQAITWFIWGWASPSSQAVTVELSALAIAPLGLALIPLGLNNLLLRPFYIRKQLLPPILISLITLGVNAYLFYLLAPRYGIAAFSWVIALSASVQLVVLLLWLQKHEGLDLSLFVRHHLRLWIYALTSVLLFYALYQQWQTTSPLVGFLAMVVCGGAGLFGFLLLSYVRRIGEARELLGRFVRRNSP